MPLVAACLVAAIGLALLSQYLAAQQAAAQSRARLDSVAKTLADASFPINQPVLRILQRLSGLEFVVSDTQGNLRETTEAIDVESAKRLIEKFKPPREVPAGNASIQFTSDEFAIGKASFRAATLLRPASPPMWLILLEPQAERRSIQQQLAFIPLITGLTTLLLVGLIALAVSQRLVKRIGSLEKEVHQIAIGKAETVSMQGPRDELHSLAQSVNQMADELRSVWKTLRDTERSRLLSQVAGGLAHQLRNAITGIHLAVQLHRRDCPMRNQESLAVAEAELARTSQYIQQLLHSAAGKSQTPRTTDLKTVLDESESLLSTIANHRRIGLTWHRHEQAEAIAIPNSDLLRSAIMNLVINALDAAGPTGCVDVAVERSGADTLIRVSDSGNGPSPELRENIFDPFVTSKPEGLGVGLTVVRSAAESFGGSVRWNRDQDRTNFELIIPPQATR